MSQILPMYYLSFCLLQFLTKLAKARSPHLVSPTTSALAIDLQPCLVLGSKEGTWPQPFHFLPSPSLLSLLLSGPKTSGFQR